MLQMPQKFIGQNNSLSSTADVLYSKEGFVVYRSNDGVVVHNTSKPFKMGHTHLKSLSYAKQLIDNVLKCKIPDTKQRYLLTSHMRVADNNSYIEVLYQVMTARGKRKQAYYNKTGRKVKNRGGL